MPNQKRFLESLQDKLQELKKSGLYKTEKNIVSPQGSQIALDDKTTFLNFCSNNYLGLANHKEVVETAKNSLDLYGFGLSSVRFICGTQVIHKQLEERISQFLKTEDTILYSSCFDANGGLFETLLGEEDAIISDSLNHASIIDGVRLCKAARLRYKNNDMHDLEERLKEASKYRYRLIATDGVFSMDGIIAKLNNVCDLAEKYDALVMCDDSHATGFIGNNGKGTHEYCNCIERVDILTGTLGKALGGASGGYTSGKKEIIDWLRQRSRPYLFSNTLAPTITTATLKVFDILETSGDVLRKRLFDNAQLFREKMTALGFNLAGADHPIVPVLLGDAKLTQTFAQEMLKRGIYVVGFSYPVVPEGKARIRVQLSAAHTQEEVMQAAAAFEEVGKVLKVI